MAATSVVCLVSNLPKRPEERAGVQTRGRAKAGSSCSWNRGGMALVPGEEVIDLLFQVRASISLLSKRSLRQFRPWEAGRLTARVLLSVAGAAPPLSHGQRRFSGHTFLLRRRRGRAPVCPGGRNFKSVEFFPILSFTFN